MKDSEGENVRIDAEGSGGSESLDENSRSASAKGNVKCFRLPKRSTSERAAEKIRSIAENGKFVLLEIGVWWLVVGWMAYSVPPTRVLRRIVNGLPKAMAKRQELYEGLTWGNGK